MKAGSWASIFGVYLFAICGSSTLSKIIPLAGDLQRTFALQTSQFAWLVAMMALPAAIFAIPSGMVVDRLGPRTVLISAGAFGILANAMYWFADGLPLIYGARLLEGLCVVHVYSAGPALIIPTTSGHRRTRSMTLWSTYAPVGTAIGLAISGLNAATDGWRMVFVFHACLWALAVTLGLFQPVVMRPAATGIVSLGQRVGELFSAFRRPQLLSLGIVLLMLISLGVGANVTFPIYFPQVDGLSAATSSNLVATATLTMVLGSALTGLILPLGIRPAPLLTLLAAAGLFAGALCFYPGLAPQMRIFPLVAWYVLTGASLATVHSTLPVVADPQRPGAAAALLNFAGAIAAFINPPLWLGVFARGEWRGFIVLLAIGWFVAVAMIWVTTRIAAAGERQKPETA